MTPTMDMQTARRYAREMLAANSDSDESDYLLSYALNKDRAWLYAHSEYKFNYTESARLKQLIEQRKAGRPWAYLKGYHEFYGLRFYVNEAVLIPRPETEIAVDCATRSAPTQARLLDLGTGCGNIAVAIAHHRPDLNITATDISLAALDIACSNAEQHQCKINFMHSDWYQNINARECFDWIISNPPYVACDDPDANHRSLACEPKHALYAEDNGIANLKTIIEGARKHLNPHGTLLIEHGCKQAQTVAQLMRDNDFVGIHCLTDTANHPRYSYAERRWRSCFSGSL